MRVDVVLGHPIDLPTEKTLPTRCFFSKPDYFLDMPSPWKLPSWQTCDPQASPWGGQHHAFTSDTALRPHLVSTPTTAHGSFTPTAARISLGSCGETTSCAWVSRKRTCGGHLSARHPDTQPATGASPQQDPCLLPQHLIRQQPQVIVTPCKRASTFIR